MQDPDLIELFVKPPNADSSLKADFYLAGRDEFHAWAFRNAKEYSVLHRPRGLGKRGMVRRSVPVFQTLQLDRVRCPGAPLADSLHPRLSHGGLSARG